jgi:iron complex outermembrane receptor protein
MALRWSDYSDFGTTRNPKFGLRFQLSPNWLLRATYAEGFRAPTLNELFQGASEDQAFISDPCTLPENVGVLSGCQQQADPSRNQFLTVTGGNARLDEETAKTWGLGLVWTPDYVPGLSASLDYFDIDTENVIDSSAQFIVNQNAANGLFPDRVTRDEAGNLQLVTATNLNVGERRVKGLDIRFDYQLPSRAWGQWSSAVNFTYIDEYSIQLDRESETVELAGTFIDPASEGLGGIPDWKGNIGIQWARQRWRGSYDIHYISDLREDIPSSTRRREIDSWLIHDVQFSYVFNLLKGLRLSMGIDNVLDKEAPFAASAFNDNIDARTHDLKGRFWYAKLSQRI